MACTNVGRPVGMDAIAVEMHSSTRVVVSWPRAMPKIGDHRHGEEGDQPEHLGHAVEFALQRRTRALGGRHHAGDLAHLGRLAGRGHHERRRAAGDLRVLEHQVRAVAERDLALGKGHPVLGDRRALAGERGLLHLQGGGGDDPAVRRDDVTGLEQHDVAGHELGRFDLLDLRRTAAPGPGAPGAAPAPPRWPGPSAPGSSP